MTLRISNYLLVTKALQILCKRLDCDFVDLPVIFEEVDSPSLRDGQIVLCKGKSVLDTMASIYSVYINALGSVSGRNIGSMDARYALMRYFISMLADFKTQYGKSCEDDNEVVNMKLDQFHAVWMLIKNIFCPYKSLKLQNIRIVAKKSYELDVVVQADNNGEPYLFVNLDIEKNSVRSAFLLVEALRIMMKSGDSPEALIREMFSNFFMRERITDFLGLAFSEDEEVANFLAVLSLICQSKDLEEASLGLRKMDKLKTAQSANPYAGNWWFLGLTEKMIDSVRGPDWSTTESLKDFSKDLWEKVESERRARGMSELPFELLLRVQSKELVTSPNLTLQQLLSKTRVW
jgi:hypothetical protein